jgi:hypothetical protein
LLLQGLSATPLCPQLTKNRVMVLKKFAESEVGCFCKPITDCELRGYKKRGCVYDLRNFLMYEKPTDSLTLNLTSG